MRLPFAGACSISALYPRSIADLLGIHYYFNYKWLPRVSNFVFLFVFPFFPLLWPDNGRSMAGLWKIYNISPLFPFVSFFPYFLSIFLLYFLTSIRTDPSTAMLLRTITLSVRVITRESLVVSPQLISNEIISFFDGTEFWYAATFYYTIQSIGFYVSRKAAESVFLFQAYITIDFSNTISLCDVYLSELVNKHFKNIHFRTVRWILFHCLAATNNRYAFSDRRSIAGHYTTATNFLIFQGERCRFFSDSDNFLL